MFGLLVLCLAGCQLLPQPALVLSPLPMPAQAALLQGQVSKGDKTQPLSLLVEADGKQVQVVVLNAFGQRSRTLSSSAGGWQSKRLIPGEQLITDGELLTAVLCLLAGPEYTQLRMGQWQGLELTYLQGKTRLLHYVEHEGDAWRGASRYRMLRNEQVVFELQWLAAPY